MRFRHPLLAVFLAALLFGLGACETASKKKVAVAPPVKQVPPPVVAEAPPPPAPMQEKAPEPPPPPPKPDPVDKLIADSQQAYDAGVEAYRTGHLDRARREFDRAVDMMLGIPEEVRNDPRVLHHFDAMIDQIHGYEMVALKEGDGFTERKTVPAPVDEIAELTFPSPPDPKLKEKVEEQVRQTTSDLPLVINDHVLSYINYFTTRGRAGFEAAIRRAGRYRDMIARVFQEEKVPQDLIYLAQAESAFQPWALSRAGAKGMWQFMAGTGRLYELNVSHWVDDRQDPEKATRAAARHLRDLYNEFGDWYLAMAAYNSGKGGVERAVERTGYADFWELYQRNALPKETRNYVPIILAATIVGKNPLRYGFDGIMPDPSIETDVVAVSVPTDLRLIAETIDCSASLLQTLNPSLLTMVTPRGEFQLRLPAGTRDRFSQQITMIPEDKRVMWRWHTVAAGEALAEIARKYKTTTHAIAEVNSLNADDELRAGAKLVIPVMTPRDGGNARTVRLRYRIRKGDTLARVADRYGVSSDDIRSWNRLTGAHLVPGRYLVIRTSVNTPGGAPKAPSKSRKKAPVAAKASKQKKLVSTHSASSQLAQK